MKPEFIVAVLALSAITGVVEARSSSSGSGSNSVSGHVRKDGTYVAPHQRTNPNQTQRDNWTSKPNTNPYTGKDGTKDPQK
ncbi:MAG: hypothetical protein IPM01_27015 [Burkholderiaceae bacterium]|nr:hypothetical protein [Burkholderiaceae bacterium]